MKLKPTTSGTFKLTLLSFCFALGSIEAVAVKNPKLKDAPGVPVDQPGQALPTPNPGPLEDISPRVIQAMSSLAQISHRREKRNAQKTIPDLSYLFPTNVNDQFLQKWLMLLTAKPKPQPQWSLECDYPEDCEDDYPPAIDLVNGKKPGSAGSGSGIGMWAAGDTSTSSSSIDPIDLYQNHVNRKKSISVSQSPGARAARRLMLSSRIHQEGNQPEEGPRRIRILPQSWFGLGLGRLARFGEN